MAWRKAWRRRENNHGNGVYQRKRRSSKAKINGINGAWRKIINNGWRKYQSRLLRSGIALAGAYRAQHAGAKAGGRQAKGGISIIEKKWQQLAGGSIEWWRNQAAA